MSIVFPPQPRPARAVADPTRCPLCVAPLAGPHCHWCDADLTSEAAHSVWQASLAVDANQQWRHRKLTQLRDETAARAAAVSVAELAPEHAYTAYDQQAGQQTSHDPAQLAQHYQGEQYQGQHYQAQGYHAQSHPEYVAVAEPPPSTTGTTSATTILVWLGAWFLAVMAAITLTAAFVGGDDSGRFVTSLGVTVVLGLLVVVRSTVRSQSGPAPFSSVDHALHSLLGIFLINTALLGPLLGQARLLATAGSLAAALAVTVVLGRITRHPSYLVMVSAMAPVCAVVLIHGIFHATAANDGHKTLFLMWQVLVYQPAQMSAALAAGLIVCAAIINNADRISRWVGPVAPAGSPEAGRRLLTSVAIGVEIMLAGYLMWWMAMLVISIATGGPASRIAALAMELGVSTALCAILAPIHTGVWARRLLTTTGAVFGLATAATVAAAIHGGYDTWWAIVAPTVVAAVWLLVVARVPVAAWLAPVQTVASGALAVAGASVTAVMLTVLGRYANAAGYQQVASVSSDLWQQTAPMVLIWLVLTAVAADVARTGRLGRLLVGQLAGKVATVATITGVVSFVVIIALAPATVAQVATAGYVLLAAMLAVLAVVVWLARWAVADHLVAATSVLVSPTIIAAVLCTWASDGWPIAATSLGVVLLLLAAVRFGAPVWWGTVPAASAATIAVAHHCITVLPQPALSADVATALTATAVTFGAALALPAVSRRLARLAGQWALPAGSSVAWLAPMALASLVIAGLDAATAVQAPEDLSAIEAATAAQLVAVLAMCWRNTTLPRVLRTIAATAAAFLTNALVVSQGLHLLPQDAVTSLGATGIVAIVHVLWALAYLAYVASRATTRHIVTWGSHIGMAVVLAIATNTTDVSTWLVLVLTVCSAPWAMRPDTPVRSTVGVGAGAAFLTAMVTKPSWPDTLTAGPFAMELITWSAALGLTAIMVARHQVATWSATRNVADATEREARPAAWWQVRPGGMWVAVVALLLIYPSQAGSQMLPAASGAGGVIPWAVAWRSSLIFVAIIGYAAVLHSRRFPGVARNRARITTVALWFVTTGPLLGISASANSVWWTVASWGAFALLWATMWRYRRPGAWPTGYWVPAALPVLAVPTWMSLSPISPQSAKWGLLLAFAVAVGAMTVIPVLRQVAWWRQIFVTGTVTIVGLLKYSAMIGPASVRVQVASLLIAVVGAALAYPLHQRGLSTWVTMTLPAGGAVLMVLPDVVLDSSQFYMRFGWLVAVSFACIAVGMANRWAAPLAAGVVGLIALAGASFAAPLELGFMVTWFTCGLVGVTLLLLGAYLDGARRRLAVAQGVSLRYVTMFR